MNIKSKSIIFPPELDHIYLIPIGDMHIGDQAGLAGKSEEGIYATSKFDGMIEWIKNTPEAYTFLMGDIFELVLRDTLGEFYNQSLNLRGAKRYIREKLEPIKNKILGAIDGNHEERLLKRTGESPVEDLCEKLGIEYFPNWCGYLFLSIGENRTNHTDKRRPIIYSVFLHHMIGGGRTVGGKLNKLLELKKMALADVYCGAHVHLKGGFKEQLVVPDFRNKTLSYAQESYTATGSYMGYAAYSLKGLYQKPATGAVRIRFNGEPIKGKDVHLSV